MSSMIMPITTERLLLRQFAPSDVDDMYAYQGRVDVARYLYRPPRSRSRCEEVIAEIATATSWASDGDVLTFAAVRRSEPGVIGEVVLKVASVFARQAEIGWAFHPDHGGRGYALEAARAVAGFAFEQLEVHRLFARLDVENMASIRLCERLGMRREAHLIENDLDGDRWGSEFIYAVLAREFQL